MSRKRSQKIPSIGELKKQLPYLPRAFKIIWAASKYWTVLWAISLVLLAFAPSLMALLTRSVIDTLTNYLSSNSNDLSMLISQAGLFAIVLIGNEIILRILAWARLNQTELIRDHITNLVHIQSSRLDMFYYDSPNYYDLLHRTKIDAVNRPITILENLGNLIRYTITFISLAVIIADYAIWLPFVIVLGATPSFLIIYYHTKKIFNWRIRNTNKERQQHYYDWVLTLRDAAEEIRLFQLGDYFRNAYLGLRTKLRNEHLELQKNKMFGEVISVLISLFVAGLVFLWIGIRAINGAASLGDLALFYQVFNQGQSIVRSSMTALSDLLGNLMYLEKLFEFLALEPNIKPLIGNPEKIHASEDVNYQFEEVTFCYPESVNKALNNFSVEIPANKITAIVGQNGAGKSTLLKLMCRFYDPSLGKIFINGKDIRKYDPQNLFSNITILFQKPVNYHTSAKSNIQFGDINRNSASEEIRQAAKMAGCDDFLSALPEEYETILGKWFGGAELSGGEWQRLALARAFYRKGKVMVLDEPTSALDSWAEMDWFNRFRTLAEGKTSVVITHRFTTAMQADIIHVMKDGQIIESGNHKELLEKDGYYAESWLAQMREAESRGMD